LSLALPDLLYADDDAAFTSRVTVRQISVTPSTRRDRNGEARELVR
jgi:hypothetical protein